jgi:hypothetical protein
MPLSPTDRRPSPTTAHDQARGHWTEDEIKAYEARPLSSSDSRRLTNRARETLRDFDALPNSAVVSAPVVAALTGLCEKSIRHHPKLKRIYVSRDRYGYRVGELRALLRGEAAE